MRFQSYHRLAIALVAGAIGIAAFAVPASASAATATTTTGEQCRVVQAKGDWKVQAYDWYCDASGDPTYHEMMLDNDGVTGTIIAALSPSESARTIETIATSHRNPGSLLWVMNQQESPSYGGRQIYLWSPVGPTTWTSTAIN